MSVVSGFKLVVQVCVDVERLPGELHAAGGGDLQEERGSPDWGNGGSGANVYDNFEIPKLKTSFI